jgi:hypothetical protein
VTFNAELLVDGLKQDSFETEPYHSIIVFFRIAATVAIAGKHVQISIRTLNDISEAAELAAE